MKKHLIDISRFNYNPEKDTPDTDELVAGCFQRIATACEAMAKHQLSLEHELELTQILAKNNLVACREVERSLSATRGVVTKLKKQLAKGKQE